MSILSLLVSKLTQLSLDATVEVGVEVGLEVSKLLHLSLQQVKLVAIMVKHKQVVQRQQVQIRMLASQQQHQNKAGMEEVISVTYIIIIISLLISSVLIKI